MNHPTLREVLAGRAQDTPDGEAVSFLSFSDAGDRLTPLTYAMLDQRARAIAARLQTELRPGDRAVLLHSSNQHFIEAFFGCIYAGVIAVPMAPPRYRSQAYTTAIANDSGARVVLCSEDQAKRFAEGFAISLPLLVTDTIADNDADAFQRADLAEDTTAFLQYTSGSTGNPKGVIVTHSSLLANLEQIRRAFQHDKDCIGVNWLPLHHDMGLIGTLLQPIYVGFPTILMSPLVFVQRPERWLQAVSKFGGTTCGGPNFAYQYCVDRITDEAKAKLDLRCWRIAYCGAEPIHPVALRRFADAFAPCGFDTGRFFPCYGLAEATLFVTGRNASTGVVVKHFSAGMLESGIANAVNESAPDSKELISCGSPYEGTEVVIADAEGRIAMPRHVGEIWVNGDNVGRGYWQRSEATQDTFCATLPGAPHVKYLRTGDLGFFDEGQLFVTGRIKDLIICDGRNIAPQDLEWTARASHPLITGSAAFGITVDNSERVVLLIEANKQKQISELQEVGNIVRRAIGDEHGISVAALVVVKSNSLPRTTSGKFMRAQCRREFLDNTLATLCLWRPGAGWKSGANDKRLHLIDTTPLLMRPNPKENPALHLFCFPYAGGGATVYVPWASQLPSPIDVCSVQLPGRQDRSGETPIRNINVLCDAFESIITACGETKYAFFGHSMGGNIAFRLARELRRRKLPEPVHLFLSAVREPQCMPRDSVPSHLLSDADLEIYLKQFGDIPAFILEQPTIRQRVFSLLRADFELINALEYPDEEPLDCPISVFGGKSDKYVMYDHLTAWKKHTKKSFTAEMLNGSHFFLEENAGDLLNRIAKHLAPFYQGAMV